MQIAAINPDGWTVALTDRGTDVFQCTVTPLEGIPVDLGTFAGCSMAVNLNGSLTFGDRKEQSLCKSAVEARLRPVSVDVLQIEWVVDGRIHVVTIPHNEFLKAVGVAP